METEIERLVVRLVGDASQYQRTLQEVVSATQSTAKEVETATRQVERFGSRVSSTAQASQVAARAADRVSRSSTSLAGTLNQVGMSYQRAANSSGLMSRVTQGLTSRFSMAQHGAMGLTGAISNQIAMFPQYIHGASTMTGMLKRYLFYAGSIVGIGSIFGGLSKAIRLAADNEQATISFEVMLGSAEKAMKMLKELRRFGAETPFQFTDLRGVAQMLMNMGLAAEQVMPTIKTLGDVSGGNATKLRGLAYVFSQVRSAGRLMGQDLMQMVNWGFNPLEQMSRKSGKSMAQLRQEMVKGLISFDMVAEAFRQAASEGGRFNNLMKRQSETITGLWSTLQDEINEAMLDIGEAIANATNLRGFVAGAISFVKQYKGFVVQGFKDVIGQIKRLVMFLREAVQPAIDFWKSLSDETRRFLKIATLVALSLAPFVTLLGTVGAMAKFVLGGLVGLILAPIAAVWKLMLPFKLLYTLLKSSTTWFGGFASKGVSAAAMVSKAFSGAVSTLSATVLTGQRSVTRAAASMGNALISVGPRIGRSVAGLPKLFGQATVRIAGFTSGLIGTVPIMNNVLTQAGRFGKETRQAADGAQKTAFAIRTWVLDRTVSQSSTLGKLLRYAGSAVAGISTGLTGNIHVMNRVLQKTGEMGVSYNRTAAAAQKFADAIRRGDVSTASKVALNSLRAIGPALMNAFAPLRTIKANFDAFKRGFTGITLKGPGGKFIEEPLKAAKRFGQEARHWFGRPLQYLDAAFPQTMQRVRNQIDRTTTWVSARWSSLQGVFQRVGASIEAKWMQVQAKVANTTRTAWEAIRTTVTSRWNAAVQAVDARTSNLASRISAQFSSLSQGIARRLAPIGAAITRVFGPAAQGVKGAFDRVWPMIRNDAKRVGGYISATFRAVGPVITSTLTSAGKAAASGIMLAMRGAFSLIKAGAVATGRVIRTMGGGLLRVVDTVAMVALTLGSFGAKAGGFLASLALIAPMLLLIGPILAGIGALFGLLINPVTLIIAGITTIGALIASAFGFDIGKMWDTGKTAAIGFFQNVKGFFINFQENWKILSAWFAQRWLVAWNVAKNITKSALAAIGTALSGISPRFKSIWELAATSARDSWEAIVKFAKIALSGIIGFFANFGDNIKILWSWLNDNWKNIFSDLGQIARLAMNGLLEALKIGFIALSELFMAFAGWINTHWRDVLSSSFGKAVIFAMKFAGPGIMLMAFDLGKKILKGITGEIKTEEELKKVTDEIGAYGDELAAAFVAGETSANFVDTALGIVERRMQDIAKINPFDKFESAGLTPLKGLKLESPEIELPALNLTDLRITQQLDNLIGQIETGGLGEQIQRLLGGKVLNPFRDLSTEAKKTKIDIPEQKLTHLKLIVKAVQDQLEAAKSELGDGGTELGKQMNQLNGMQANPKVKVEGLESLKPGAETIAMFIKRMQELGTFDISKFRHAPIMRSTGKGSRLPRGMRPHQVQAPQIQAPQIQAPQVNIPQMPEMGDIDMPGMEAPHVNMPAMPSPDFQVPMPTPVMQTLEQVGRGAAGTVAGEMKPLAARGGLRPRNRAEQRRLDAMLKRRADVQQAKAEAETARKQAASIIRPEAPTHLLPSPQQVGFRQAHPLEILAPQIPQVEVPPVNIPQIAAPQVQVPRDSPAPIVTAPRLQAGQIELPPIPSLEEMMGSSVPSQAQIPQVPPQMSEAARAALAKFEASPGSPRARWEKEAVEMDHKVAPVARSTTSQFLPPLPGIREGREARAASHEAERSRLKDKITQRKVEQSTKMRALEDTLKKRKEARATAGPGVSEATRQKLRMRKEAALAGRPLSQVKKEAAQAQTLSGRELGGMVPLSAEEQGIAAKKAADQAQLAKKEKLGKSPKALFAQKRQLFAAERQLAHLQTLSPKGEKNREQLQATIAQQQTKVAGFRESVGVGLKPKEEMRPKELGRGAPTEESKMLEKVVEKLEKLIEIADKESRKPKINLVEGGGI